jgi:hypothetical protein
MELGIVPVSKFPPSARLTARPVWFCERHNERTYIQDGWMDGWAIRFLPISVQFPISFGIGPVSEFVSHRKSPTAMWQSRSCELGHQVDTSIVFSDHTATTHRSEKAFQSQKAVLRSITSAENATTLLQKENDEQMHS